MSSPPGNENATRQGGALKTVTDANIDQALGDSKPAPAPVPRPHVHVLRTAVGVVIEATLDPVTFQFNCCWSPPPPYPSKKFKKIMREYVPWRDAIMEEAAQRAGIRVLMVTPGIDGVPLTVVYGLKAEGAL